MKNADGEVVRVLARRSLRRGSIALAFGNPGSYALRVGKATRRFVVNTDCEDNGKSAELRLGATSVRAGGVLPYGSSTPATTSAALMAGRGYGFDLRLPDGTWAPLNAGQGFTADGVQVAPWASFAKQMPVTAGAASGP